MLPFKVPLALIFWLLISCVVSHFQLDSEDFQECGQLFSVRVPGSDSEFVYDNPTNNTVMCWNRCLWKHAGVLGNDGHVHMSNVRKHFHGCMLTNDDFERCKNKSEHLANPCLRSLVEVHCVWKRIRKE